MGVWEEILIGICTGLISGAIVALFQWLLDEKYRFEQDKNEYAKYLDLVQLELSEAYKNRSVENLNKVLCNSPNFQCIDKYIKKDEAVADALNEAGDLQEEIVKLINAKEILSAAMPEAAEKEIKLGHQFSSSRLKILKLKFRCLK